MFRFFIFLIGFIVEKLKQIYKNYSDIVNILIIVFISLIGFYFFKGHFFGFFTDKGREMLFPSAILQGKILYKDILCIYFPFAFQINAVFFKLFGENISVLMSAGIFSTILSSCFLYLISKEFINKNLSIIFILLCTIAVAFNGALFNSILPYSFSFTYGITAYLISTYFALMYLKDKNSLYIFISYFFAGGAFACKGEFGILFLILCLFSFLEKPFNFKQFICNLLIYSVLPLISFGILFYQGLSFSELFSAFDFMKKFFTTDSMLYHIGRTGGIFKFENFSLYFDAMFKYSIFCIVSFLIYKYTKFNKLLLIVGVAACVYLLNFTSVEKNTILLPIITVIFLIWKRKTIFNNKPLLFLILASLSLNIRMFWQLIITTYGIHTSPLLIIAFLALLFKFFPDFKYLKNQEIRNYTTFLLLIYLIFFTLFTYKQLQINTTKVKTQKGTIYLPELKAKSINTAMQYINQYIEQDKKILVLPEGMLMNFLTDRSLDFKVPMADRLYYEALGPDKIINSIEKTDYEAIFLIEGMGITNFGRPYLYDVSNPVLKYINQKYILDWKTEYIEKGEKQIIYCYVKPY